VNKEITFLGQLGQGRHARVRLGLIREQYRAIKMYETRFQNEFEREYAIFQTDLIQHPNILSILIINSFVTQILILSIFLKRSLVQIFLLKVLKPVIC
jgi:hypothetical protein